MMSVKPQSVEQWFRTATFVTGFGLICLSAGLFILRDTISWELLTTGASLMGVQVFAKADEKAEEAP